MDSAVVVKPIITSMALIQHYCGLTMPLIPPMFRLSKHSKENQLDQHSTIFMINGESSSKAEPKRKCWKVFLDDACEEMD